MEDLESYKQLLKVTADLVELGSELLRAIEEIEAVLETRKSPVPGPRVLFIVPREEAQLRNDRPSI